jgi:hypothetical protein
MLGVTWQLVRLFGEEIVDDKTITMQFKEERNTMDYTLFPAVISISAVEGSVSAFGGCNHLEGKYRFDTLNTIFNQTVAITHNVCPGDIMKREQAFLKALYDTEQCFLSKHNRVSELSCRNRKGFDILQLEAPR